MFGTGTTLLALLLSSLLFTACGSGSNTTKESRSETEAGKNEPAEGMKIPLGEDKTDRVTAPENNPKSGLDTITTMSGLRYIVQKSGIGTKVESGMSVKIDYAGFLTDGTLFDTSIKAVGDENGFDRGGYPFEPIAFVVGTGRVIKGWDEALIGMQVGGKRRLIIPPDLGYGSRGAPPVIPPNATLIFDVHVLEATK